MQNKQSRMQVKDKIQEKSPFSGTRATMSSLKNDENKEKFLGPDIMIDGLEHVSDQFDDSQNCSQQFSSLSQLNPFYFKDELFSSQHNDSCKKSQFQKKQAITFQCLTNLENYKFQNIQDVDDSLEELKAIESEFHQKNEVPNEVMDNWNKINCSKDTFFKMPKQFKMKLKQAQDCKSLQQLPRHSKEDNSPTLFNGKTFLNINTLDQIDESQFNKIKRKILTNSYKQSDFDISSSKYIQKLFKSQQV